MCMTSDIVSHRKLIIKEKMPFVSDPPIESVNTKRNIFSQPPVHQMHLDSIEKNQNQRLKSHSNELESQAVGNNSKNVSQKQFVTPVCGDKEFKQKFTKKIKNELFSKDLSKITTNNSRFFDPSKQSSQKEEQSTTKNFDQNHDKTIAALNQSIYASPISKHKLFKKLSLDQKHVETRESRCLKSFSKRQHQWSTVESFLSKKMQKKQPSMRLKSRDILKSRQPTEESQNSQFNFEPSPQSSLKPSYTTMFGEMCTKKLYVHQNPEKMSIINDMVPEYWKNSLRNNEKRLKYHLRGNHFKQEHSEEMLQTLKGTRTLESSIPKISHLKPYNQKSRVQATIVLKLKGISPIKKSLSQTIDHTGNISLNQSNSGTQTMRQFYRNISVDEKTLDSSVQENSTFQFKTSKNRCSIRNSKRINDLKFSQEKSRREKDIEFSKTLQALDKVDGQVLTAKFDRSKKWIHEPFQTLY